MHATVDQQGCIGCGLCTGICSAVFALNDEGKAEAIVDPIPPEAQALAEAVSYTHLDVYKRQ